MSESLTDPRILALLDDLIKKASKRHSLATEQCSQRSHILASGMGEILALVHLYRDKIADLP